MTNDPLHNTQRARLQQLDKLLSGETRMLRAWVDSEEELHAALQRQCNDVLGGLVASRVALQDTYVASTKGRDHAKLAEEAILLAEKALLAYRESLQ